MNFTVYNNPEINKKIKKDIDYIAGRVAALLGNDLHSVLLCGGFGRGEGSVVIENGNIHIVNDYDFTVVLNVKNRFHYLSVYRRIRTPLEKLAVSLAEELSIKQIDLSPKPPVYFKKTNKLKIENYEVKKGHYLVYGKKNPTSVMPDWKASDIPLFEGTWLFRNRGTGLLLAALYFMKTKGKTIHNSKKENFVIECTKAQLAIGDSILLMHSNYHHLYSNRTDCMNAIDISEIPHNKTIKPMYQKAVKQKLTPDFETCFKKDLVSWWFDITDTFNNFFFHYEKKRLQMNFDNWVEYDQICRKKDKIELKTFVKKIITMGHTGFSLKKIIEAYYRSKKTYSVSLVPLVLFALKKNGIDRVLMERAARILKIDLCGDDEKDWVKLSEGVLNEIHPTGEAARILAELPIFTDN